MGDYENLRTLDIITPAMQEVLTVRRFTFCSDGKFRPTGRVLESMHIDGPWINVRVCSERNCFLWSHIYFNSYGIISRNCFNCWKVVLRPKTLEDLFKIYKMQIEDKDEPFCKSGIERREGSLHKGRYACFWYNPLGDGLVMAKEFHKKIEKKVHHILGVDNKVILKRGCTEMEDRAGPSHEWRFTDDQHVYEDLLDFAWSEIKPTNKPEPPTLRNTIMSRWIGHAVKHRDKTAKKYYDSMQSFGVAPTTLYNDKEVKVSSVPLTAKQWREYNDAKTANLTIN